MNSKAADVDIIDVTADPALCKTGTIYVAAESETVDSTRFGVRLDGRDYIDQAIRNGASVILTTADALAPDQSEKLLIWLSCDTPLRYLGELAARLCGRKSPQNVALVTGTNGKTSVVNFCRMMWTAQGHASCSVGNLGGVCSDGSIVWPRDSTLSVPETVFLHKMLRELALKDVQYVALEATSHALHDYRLHGVNANIGAFTNLTRDHLDFHGTMHEYFRMKMRLFEEVMPAGSTAVINADSDRAAEVISICRAHKHAVLTFGHCGSEIRLHQVEHNSDGQLLDIEILGERFKAQLNLFGAFQASNALCALGIVIASGGATDIAARALQRLSPVEGRLNLVACTPSGGKIIVDYAHTPDGIRAALEACRSLTPGKVIIVFGANGDRDPGKRPEMGTIAQSLADKVIVTDGHPRNESPAAIRRAIITGAPNAIEIPDRYHAITEAIKLAGSDDTVLLAGFGHENYQVVGNARLPFDETNIARTIVRELSEQKIKR